MLKSIIKKIYLLRKAYLTKFYSFHYSQFGEDIILRELLRTDFHQGFYIDVGCYHPRKYSNTYNLYKNGWRGINIDMEEDKIKLFNIIRPLDHNVLSAVSDKKETVTLYRYSKFGVGSTIDDDFASKVGQKLFDKKQVFTKTLNEIISDSPYSNKQIDILSIDVEGMDFKVLNSLDFETYKPKIIIVEDHHKDLNAIFKTDIWHLLSSKGYSLRSWTFYSLIFILPNSDILQDREHQI
jgi:FkbM family methyltransferase